MNLFYAGVGSRKTPNDVLEQMEQIAEGLGRIGWTLRSGGQPKGADGAFERGAKRVNGKKEIFLPWDGFADKFHSQEQGYFAAVDKGVVDKALQFHPAPHRLSVEGRLLMARNLQIVLGMNLNIPVDMLICWTPKGSTIGGTGHDIRVAKHYNIPVFNLWNDNCLNDLETFLRFNY